jgi:hypothetical protein
MSNELDRLFSCTFAQNYGERRKDDCLHRSKNEHQLITRTCFEPFLGRTVRVCVCVYVRVNHGSSNDSRTEMEKWLKTSAKMCSEAVAFVSLSAH